MSARHPPSRDALIVFAAALVALAAGLVALSPAPVGVFWDDAVYVITGKALATGAGYRYIHLPGAPAATHYPPLWPAVLSLVWRALPQFPDNVRTMKLLNPLFLAIAAAGATMLAVRAARVAAWLAAVVVAAASAVAPVLLLSAVLMSEPMCLALTAAAVAFATMMIMRGRPRDGLIAGALVGLSILTRSAALVLLPALAVGLLWRRSRRASALALAVALVCIAPWFVWSARHAHELPPVLAGSYGPYTSWVLDAYRAQPGLMWEVARQNTVGALHDSGVVLFGGLPPAMRVWFVPPLLVLTLAGLAMAGRRAAALSVTLVCYAILIVVWPYPPGRFMWALFPLYAVGALVATATIARRFRRRMSGRVSRATSIVAMAFAAATLLMVVRYDARGMQRGWYKTAIETNADGMVGPVGWIARNTAPTDTIATDVHLLAYLYAGRIAVPVNSLTVDEDVHGKTDAQMRKEFAAIDSTFHPRFWVITGMVPERFAFAKWASEPGSPFVFAPLPGDGIAAKVNRR